MLSTSFLKSELEGIPLIVQKSGWSKQGGFELYLRDGSKGVLIPAKVNIALGVISIALDITEKEVYDLYGPASRNFLATKRPHWVIAYHRKNVTYPAHQHTMLQMRKLRAKNRQLAQN